MKKYAILFLMTLMVMGALCAMGQTGAPDSERLGPFDSVSIGIPAETVIRKGSQTSVDIEMSDRIARNLEIYNDRGTLVIKSKGGSWIRKADNIKILITMPYFNTVKLSSSGTIRSEDHWSGDLMALKTSGSGDLYFESMDADKITVKSSGSGDIRVPFLSAMGELVVSLTGSGEFVSEAMESNSLDIGISGSGDVTGDIRTSRLEVGISGSGDVMLSGSADTAELKTTGSGNIEGDELYAGEANIKITGSGNVSLKEGSRLKEIRMTGSGVFRSH